MLHGRTLIGRRSLKNDKMICVGASAIRHSGNWEHRRSTYLPIFAVNDLLRPSPESPRVAFGGWQTTIATASRISSSSRRTTQTALHGYLLYRGRTVVKNQRVQ
jgi:hypothetical protein